MDARIPETYQWLIVPGQPDPQGQPNGPSIGFRAREPWPTASVEKLKTEELLMVDMGGSRLRHEIDRIPLWRGDHVPIRQLCEDMARYLYLPRVRNESVILTAIREATERPTWKEDGLAYAESWDDQKAPLQGPASRHVWPSGRRPRQFNRQAGRGCRPARDRAAPGRHPATRRSGRNDSGSRSNYPDRKRRLEARWRSDASTPLPPVLRRFHGSVALDPIRTGNDASRIADEVLSHLSGILGAKVQVTLDIQVVLPGGASDKLVRDVTENCRTLKFGEYGFEEF